MSERSKIKYQRFGNQCLLVINLMESLGGLNHHLKSLNRIPQTIDGDTINASNLSRPSRFHFYNMANLGGERAPQVDNPSLWGPSLLSVQPPHNSSNITIDRIAHASPEWSCKRSCIIKGLYRTSLKNNKILKSPGK